MLYFILFFVLIIVFILKKFASYLNIKEIFNHSYIYNLSWEDGLVDRNILKLTNNDIMLCITTGGDNILNYLIDDVKIIHTVDVNKYQNYLLELKMSMIKVLTLEDFYKVFNSRDKNSDGYKIFLDNLDKLKENMSDDCKEWIENNKIDFSHFIESGSVKFLVKLMKALVWFYGLNNLFECNSIEEQIKFYEKNNVEKIFQNIHNILWYPTILSYICPIIGVPKKQLDLLEKNDAYVFNLLKYLVFNIELKKNYFFYPYIGGKFSEDCCPDYLKEKNYLKVRERLNRIIIHTDYVQNVCKKVSKNGDDITKVILLDHMDWLDENEIINEWDIYKKYCNKDCTYLWRSASKKKYIGCLNELNYLEHYILDHSSNTLKNDIMADRIGMYYSTYIAKIPDNVIMIKSITPNYHISFANKLYIFYQMMIAPFKSKINIKNHEDELNQFYENQATLYDAYRQNMLHGKKHLVPMIPFKEYDNLLILAGGTGDIIDHMPYINKLKRVVIVDLCEKLLNVAKKRNNLENIKIIHHDATTYKSKKKFDKIIITYSLTMIPDWKKTIDVIKNNLKDGGYVGVADFTTKSNNIFEILNGYLFKNMFKTDGVILNEKHISILDKEFNRVNCYIDYGGFPFIPFIKCPYYYGLWKKV